MWAEEWYMTHFQNEIKCPRMKRRVVLSTVVNPRDVMGKFTVQPFASGPFGVHRYTVHLPFGESAKAFATTRED